MLGVYAGPPLGFGTCVAEGDVGCTHCHSSHLSCLKFNTTQPYYSQKKASTHLDFPGDEFRFGPTCSKALL